MEKTEILQHLIAMQNCGIVEVVGMSEDGQEVWGITDFAKSLTDDQVYEIIQRSYEAE